MRCERCGAELSADGYCPSCGAEACNAEEPHVQVLSPAERNAYRGVTIEEGNPEEGGARSVKFHGFFFRLSFECTQKKFRFGRVPGIGRRPHDCCGRGS